jgi:hypothetical protein
VQAFLPYLISRQATESAEASYQVVSARLEIGEVTLSEQIWVRSSVGDAAMVLFESKPLRRSPLPLV